LLKLGDFCLIFSYFFLIRFLLAFLLGTFQGLFHAIDFHFIFFYFEFQCLDLFVLAKETTFYVLKLDINVNVLEV